MATSSHLNNAGFNQYAAQMQRQQQQQQQQQQQLQQRVRLTAGATIPTGPMRTNQWTGVTIYNSNFGDLFSTTPAITPAINEAEELKILNQRSRAETELRYLNRPLGGSSM